MVYRFVIAIAAMLATVNAAAGNAELTAVIRQVLEPELRSKVGYGFSAFDCAVEPPLGTGDRFRCEAVDEVGDRLRYTIEVDEEGGATVVRADQPASSLAESDLAMLEAPCRSFFDDFFAGRWQKLYASLHPALQSQLGGVERVRAMLEPVLEFYGGFSSAQPTWLAVRADGEQELECALVGAKGNAVARFAFAYDEAGVLRLSAFVVTAPAGSPEQARWLELEGVRTLTPVIGTEIARIDAPLEKLVSLGDSVEGAAVLKDGREIEILVEQRGIRDDFDIDDFHFAVLDVVFLLERALRPKLEGFSSVTCDAAVVPDGGEAECVVHLASGDDARYIVRRRGGDHRLFPAEPAS